MDNIKTGKLIYSFRKEKGLTQKALADFLCISDKAVSKWERGLGCPDVSFLPELSSILGAGILEILEGDLSQNDEVSGNMKNINFHICGTCGNIITSTGNASVSCCGKNLAPEEATKPDKEHELTIEPIEDEFFISSSHEMTKQHYISFVAFATSDKLVMTKLYPEWGMQTRMQKQGHGKLFYYCSGHGLFFQQI